MNYIEHNHLLYLNGKYIKLHLECLISKKILLSNTQQQIKVFVGIIRNGNTIRPIDIFIQTNLYLSRHYITFYKVRQE